MNKKEYQKPAMQVHTITVSNIICSSGGSPAVTSVVGGVFNSAPTAGNGDARSRSVDVWDDDEY